MFSVQNDDPFIVFQQLKEIARNHHDEADIIDLSRGDPGFCFTPSVRGRRFASFILLLDSRLNTGPEDKFLLYSENDEDKTMRMIDAIAHETYASGIADSMLADFRIFLDHAKRAAAEEGKTWSDFSVLQELFSYNRMSGGSYLKPTGEDLARIIVAAWHRAELGVHVTSDDLIFTSGVSHAIGTLFKAFGSEGCNFLQKGDAVCIGSPVYSPYNGILLERGITPITFAMDPVTGRVDPKDKAKIRDSDLRIKALILIDPNNPTGFSLPEEEIQELAAIAKQRDLLIITDEVYSSFFPKKKSIIHYCPERTIHLNARSKIERSTGLRFGEIIILPEGKEHIARLVGLESAAALWKQIIFAKAPGRTGGQFQHTTFVPGPSQLLGISHLVLGGDERKAYVDGLMENRSIFYKELQLPHEGNLYYVLFDLNQVDGCTTQNLSIEDRLIALAEAGIIYIPAYRFFAESERGKPGTLTSVRASIVNTTPDRLKVAAERTKAVLCGKGNEI